MIKPHLSNRARQQMPAPTSVGGGHLYVVRAPTQTGDPVALWTALHGLLPSRSRRRAGARPWISAELVGHGGRVELRLWIPDGQAEFVAALLRGSYPGAELIAADDDVAGTPDGGGCVGASRVFVRDAWLPLRTDQDGDPLATLFATLARAGTDERIVVAFAVRPRPDGWQRTARRHAERLVDPQPNAVVRALFGEPLPQKPRTIDRQHARAIHTKADQVGFDVAIRVRTEAGTQIAADEYLRAVAAALRIFNGPTTLAFDRLRPRGRARVTTEMQRHRFPTTRLSVLTAAELAGMWHLPTDAYAYVDAVRAPKLPAPAEVPSSGRVIGVTNFAGIERRVAVPWRETRRHTAIVGSSGAGKTVLMENLAVQDVHADRAVVVLDSGDGSMCRHIMAHVPAFRDVVWITSDDPSVSVTINVFEHVSGRRELVAEQTLAIWQARWELGPRSEALAKALLLSALANPDASLAMVARMLVDPILRRRVLAIMDDPTGVGVSAFWRWFEHLSDAQQTEVVSPLSTKLTDFLIRPRLRRLLSGRSTIDLRRLLDNRAIILVDLAPGKWGGPAAELVGSFVLAAVVNAVLERADTPDVARPDVALYLDEFQLFVGGVPGTLETALQQVRKFGCSITVATQSLAALPRATRDAIATNTSTKCLFGLGPDDARSFATEFAPLTAAALGGLGPHEMAVRVALAGTTSAPFTARASPPLADDPARAAAIGARATARYARPVEQIDTELAQSLQPTVPEPSHSGVGRRSRRS